MERAVAENFLNKFVVFKKSTFDKLLIGRLESVTDSTILIRFKEQLQVHPLSEIVEMREGIEKPEFSGRGF